MNKEPKFPKLRPINPRCLTPFTLYQPVPTLQSENMTYIEYLMGILTQINQLISVYNNLSNEVEGLMNLPGRMDEIEQAFTNLEQQITQKIIELGNAIKDGDKATLEAANKYTDDQIEDGDKATLEAANKYTDDQIANIADGGGGGGSINAGLTAERYDGLSLAAVDYDDMHLTAREYDTQGQIIFFGDLSTIYLQFKNSFTVSPLQNIFEMPNPPVRINRRYIFEISLGNFSLNENQPAKLEIVGNNTLGNTLPITVPNGGSARVVGIFTAKPSAIRLMSGEDQISGQNAYIKIKPLGES